MSNQLLLTTYNSSSFSQASFYLEPEEIPKEFDDKVKMLGELLHGLKPKRRYKDKERKRVEDAYSLLRSMSYQEQEDFYEQYPHLADAFFAALSWFQLEQSDAGIIAGMDISTSKDKEDRVSGTFVYKNEVLNLLDNPETYKDQELLGLLLELVNQVAVHPEDNTTLKADKEKFLQEVKKLRTKHHDPTLDQITIKEEEKVPHYKGYYGNAIKSIGNARKRSKGNTRGAKTIANFLLRFGLGNREIILHRYSLYEFQNNKDSGGHVYGMQFGQAAMIDLDADFDDGKATILGSQLPFNALHYFSSNFSLHTAEGSLHNIGLTAHWPTNKGHRLLNDPDHLKRNELVPLAFDLNSGDLEMKHLRYAGRSNNDKNKDKSKDEQSSIALGNITVKGLKIKGMYQLVPAKFTRNGLHFMYGLTDGFQNMSLLLMYAVMTAVDQIVGTTKYDASSILSFKSEIIQQLQGHTDITCSFESLSINHIIDSSNGYIGNFSLGPTTIAVSEKKESGLSLEEEAAIDSGINQVRLELAKKEAKQLKQYERKATRLRKGKNHDELDKKIKQLDTEIQALKTTLTDQSKDQRFTVSITSQDQGSIKDGAMVDHLIKDILFDYLQPFQLLDMKGMDDILLPAGLTVTSEIGIETISDTTVTVPRFELPLIEDDLFFVDLGGFILKGHNLKGTGIWGQLSAKWKDLEVKDKDTKPGKSELDLTDLSINDGELTLSSFEFVDALVPTRNIKLTGTTTLKGLYLKFPEIGNVDYEKGDLQTIVFGCTSIETEDIAAVYQLNEDQQKQEGTTQSIWFKERRGSKVVLYGFELQRDKPVEIAKPSSTETGLRQEKMKFSLKAPKDEKLAGKIDNLQAMAINVNAGVTHFSMEVTSLITTQKAAKEGDKDIDLDRSRNMKIKFGLDKITVPYSGFENNDMSIHFVSYTNEAKAGWTKHITDLKEYIQKVEKGNYSNKSAAIADAQAQIADLERKLTYDQAGTDAIFEGIDVDMEVDMCTPAAGADAFVEQIKVHSAYAEKVSASNVKFIFKNEKGDKEFSFRGGNEIFGLKAEHLTRANGKFSLDVGGILGAQATALTQFTSSFLTLSDVTSGQLKFERLTDSNDISYSFNDIMGKYKVPGMLSGNQSMPLDLAGIINYDEASGKLHATLSTTDTITLPQVTGGGVTISAPNGTLLLKGLTFDMEAQFKKVKKDGEDTKELQYAVFHSLKIDKLSSLGSLLIKQGDIVLQSLNGEENSVENIELKELRYDAEKKGMNAITGTITTGAIDLSHFEKISKGKSGEDGFVQLLKGGINADSMSFNRVSDGKMTINMANPQVFGEKVNYEQLTVVPEMDSLNELFSAAEITYTNRKEIPSETSPKEKPKVVKGNFYTIKNPVLNQINVTGNVKMGSKEVVLNELILKGAVNGTLYVDVYDDYISIDAMDGEITIDSFDIYTPDYHEWTKKPENPVHEQDDYDLELQQTIEKAGISQEEYDRIQQENTRMFWDRLNESSRLYQQQLLEKNRIDPEGGIGQSLKASGIDPSSIYNQNTEPQTQSVDTFVPNPADSELRRKIAAIDNEISARRYAEITEKYNFLDSLTGGTVAIRMFGQNVNLNITYLDPQTGFGRTSAQVGNFVPYVDIDRFILDLTTVIYNNTSGWVAWVLGDLYTQVDDGVLQLWADAFDLGYDPYIMALVSEDDIMNIGGVRQARLKGLVSMSTDMDAQSSQSIMGAPASNEAPSYPVPNITTALFQYLHTNMNPQLIITDAEFDLNTKTDAQQGLLRMINAQQGDPNLSFDKLKVSLNQDRRVDTVNLFGYNFYRRELGPQLEITGFTMPSYRSGLENNTKSTFFEGKGLNFGYLKMGIDQLDLNPSLNPKEGTEKHKDPLYNSLIQNSISSVARMEGKNVTLKGFKMHLPKKKKK